MIWFTSDQHFGHHNIIQYCHRPFKNTHIMDREIIARYNEVVTNDDTVYFLGDFTLYQPDKANEVHKLIRQLKGKKHLILGNHDKLRPATYISFGFESVHTQLEIDKFILIHDPAQSYKQPNRLHIVGHVHNLWTIQGNCYNVSIERHNYYPVKYEYVAEHLTMGNFS